MFKKILTNLYPKFNHNHLRDKIISFFSTKLDPESNVLEDWEYVQRITR